MKLLGLLMVYLAAYLAGALVLLRLLTGQWPDRVRPGSRVDWFEADLERERRSVRDRLRSLFAPEAKIPGRVDPRSADLMPYERAQFGVAAD